MRNLFFGLFTIFSMHAQENKTSEIINPDEKWFFGAEIGTNTITSFNFGEPNKSLQGGVLAEFYTGRHWSLTGRIKYFKTGVSYYIPNTHSGSWFDLGHDESFGQFEGAVITLPLNIKWEFRIHKNFSGNLNLGINYNYETESNYFYSNVDNYSRFKSKEYSSYNSGFGFNYFISKKMGVFLNIESYIGGVKGNTESFIFSSQIHNTNTLVNFGIKYSFKKDKI
jgi:hypothetical protein